MSGFPTPAQMSRLRRVAREAQRTYVGSHWPSMETLRVNGLSVDLTEDRKHDPAIRSFISTFGPEFVGDLLLALAAERAWSERLRGELRLLRGRLTAIEKGGHHIVPLDGFCAVCGRGVYETGDYRGGRYKHGTP